MRRAYDREDYLTAGEIASLLRVSRGTVWRWGRDGVIPRVRVGSTIRYDAVAVKALLEGEDAA